MRKSLPVVLIVLAVAGCGGSSSSNSGGATVSTTCTPGLVLHNSANTWVPISNVTSTMRGFTGYRLIFTNTSSETVDVTGWVVTFYNASGAETGSDQETKNVGGFIPPGQSRPATWLPDPWDTSTLLAPFEITGDLLTLSGTYDTEATCQVTKWYGS